MINDYSFRGVSESDLLNDRDYFFRFSRMPANVINEYTVKLIEEYRNKIFVSPNVLLESGKILIDENSSFIQKRTSLEKISNSFSNVESRLELSELSKFYKDFNNFKP